MVKPSKKQLKEIKKKIAHEKLGKLSYSKRPQDILLDVKDKLPFQFSFEREENLVYYHVIPKYRRLKGEHIPKGYTDEEQLLNYVVDESIYPTIQSGIILYLLRNNEQSACDKLSRIIQKYSDTIQEIIALDVETANNLINDQIIELPTLYPHIPEDTLTEYLMLMIAATQASTLCITNPELIADSRNHINMFLADIRHLVIDAYPSLKSINQIISSVKSDLASGEKEVQRVMNNMSESELAADIPTSVLLSYYTSFEPHIPKAYDMVFETDRVLKALAQDKNYSKNESKAIIDKLLPPKILGVFLIEYFIVYSFYVEIMPHLNMYLSFSLPENFSYDTYETMINELVAITDDHLTHDTNTNSLNIPKNSHGMASLTSPSLSTNGDHILAIDNLLSTLLINPMHSASISVSDKFINHVIDPKPIETVNMLQADRTKLLVEHLYTITNQDDMFSIITTVANRIQVAMQAIHADTQELESELSEANTLVARQTITIDELQHNSTDNTQEAQQSYDDMYKQLEEANHKLELEQQRYELLSKELAPYENLKHKTIELNEEIERLQDINSYMDERLENVIKHQSESDTEYDEDAFILELQNKSVFIVGGHEHWRSDMQALLPNAKIVAPEHNNASVDNAKSADYVIINIGMLNHSISNRVKTAYKANENGQILYLNTQASNISITLQQLHSQCI